MEFLGLLGILAGGLGLAALVDGGGSSGDDGDVVNASGLNQENISDPEETVEDVNDDETVEDDETGGDVDDDEPDDDTDIGAIFGFDAASNTVTIDVGEDETGTVAAFTFVDTTDNEDDFLLTYEARYYLVPEGVDWSSASWETRYDIPTPNGEVTYYLGIKAFEEAFGLELLGTVNLDPDNALDYSDVIPEPGHVEDDLPELISNVPVDVYYMEANTDGGELVEFLPADFTYTHNGTPATEEIVGTDGDDYMVANDTPYVTLDGQGGDDRLEANVENVTLKGGDGNDVFVPFDSSDIEGGAGNDTVSLRFVDGQASDETGTSGVYVDGGSGDDRIELYADSMADGGDGNDIIAGYGSGNYFWGEAGNDHISISGQNSVAIGGSGDDLVEVSGQDSIGYGGVGNDILSASDHGIVVGDEGDDVLYVGAGAEGYSGDGDDLVNVWNFHQDPAGRAIVGTGAGNDIIDVDISNPYNGRADDLYLEVIDFDPDKDVLQLGPNSKDHTYVDEYEIIEAEDGSYTDIEVRYTPYNSSLEPGIAVIRLAGTTGVTADNIKLAIYDT